MSKYKIALTFLCFFLLFPVFSKAYDWETNGGNAGTGSSAGGDCDNYDGFCLYNSKVTKGIRITLAYCDSEKCKQVTSVNGKNVNSHDIWYSNLARLGVKFNYFGYNKTTPSLKTASKNNYNSNYTNKYASTVDASLPIFSGSSDQFFNNIEDVLTSNDKKNNFSEKLLSYMGTNSKDLEQHARKEANTKPFICGKGQSVCSGYRILIEPIFWWKSNYGKKNWLLTPTELLWVTNKNGYYDMAGTHDYRLYTAGVSLHISSNDILYQVYPRSFNMSRDSFVRNTTFSFRQDYRDYNYGLGLNILNPLFDVKTNPSCEAVMAYNKINIKNCSALKATISNKKELVYDEAGNKVSADWFYNECSCCGMYDHFEKSALKHLVTVNKKDILKISSDVFNWQTNWYQALDRTTKKFRNLSIKDYKSSKVERILYRFNEYDNQWTKISSAKSLPWTKVSEKYVNLNCGYEETYWCKEFQDWYTETNKKFGLNYPNIYGMTTQDIKGKNKKQVANMLKAYNTVYYSAMGFEWSINTDIFNYFSYSKYCAKDAPPRPEDNCDKINAYYGIDILSSNKTCDYIDNFSFYSYNQTYDTKIKSEWYAANCGCQVKKPIECTPDYKVGTCTGKDDNVSYKDSNDWENCIFNDNGSYSIDVHKTSKPGGELSYKDDDLSNDYCEVFCIEQVETNFDKKIITVEAGKNFVWNNHILNGSRTCRTKNINWDGFTTELAKDNNDAETFYQEYRIAKFEEDMVYEIVNEVNTKDSIELAKEYGTVTNVKKTISNEKNCDSHTEPSTTLDTLSTTCTYDKNGAFECEGNSNKTPPSNWKCGAADEDSDCAGTKKDCTITWTKQCTVTTTITVHNGYTVSFTGKLDGKKASAFYCSTTAEAEKTKYRETRTTKETNYKDSIVAAKSKYNKMKACYSNWDTDSKLYNLDPVVKIYYSNGEYGYDGILEKELLKPVIDENLDCKDTKVGLVNTCRGSTCSKLDIDIKKCKDVEMTKSQEIKFSLEEGIYKYILKDSHESIKTEAEFNALLNAAKNNGKPLNYINLGYSNFPVSFKTKDGLYGYGTNKGKLSLTYEYLGHKKNSSTAVDKILNATDKANYKKWDCNFRVVSSLIPGGGDINLIFRPIDLNNPFPDLTGLGRNTGDNWCNGNNCLNNNNVVKNYILNNRGVTTNEIYNKEPMYSFVLTPPVIREIRKYSRSLDNEYGTFDGISCDAATGGRCISEYLTKLSKITKTSGTCMTNDRKDSFTTCQYRVN